MAPSCSSRTRARSPLISTSGLKEAGRALVEVGAMITVDRPSNASACRTTPCFSTNAKACCGVSAHKDTPAGLRRESLARGPAAQPQCPEPSHGALRPRDGPRWRAPAEGSLPRPAAPQPSHVQQEHRLHAGGAARFRPRGPAARRRQHPRAAGAARLRQHRAEAGSARALHRPRGAAGPERDTLLPRARADGSTSCSATRPSRTCASSW